MVSKVITIDGPAAAGKTTLAHLLAHALNIGVLNAGALYRAATWVMRRDQLQQADPQTLLGVLENTSFNYQDDTQTTRLWAGDQEITDQLRDPQLTREIKLVANVPEIRQWMNQWQRDICSKQWKVAEGRDEGTEVFPDSPAKIFLTAHIDVRHKRRMSDLMNQNISFDPEQLKKDMTERDHADETRPVGALRVAQDAFVIDSSNMTVDEVMTAALHWVKKNVENMEGGLPVTLTSKPS